MRSNATAEMSTPDPNAMTVAITPVDTWANHAISAPRTSAPPPSSPQSPASSQVGTAHPPHPAARRWAAAARWLPRANCSLNGRSVGVAEQVPAEVRDGERDLPALGRVDEPLLDQRVP